jgi:hypothetical protein
METTNISVNPVTPIAILVSKHQIIALVASLPTSWYTAMCVDAYRQVIRSLIPMALCPVSRVLQR